MEHRLTDLVAPADRFSYLTTVEKVAGRSRRWLCLCDCGNTTIAYQTQLLRKKKVSCGCIKPTILNYHKPDHVERSKKFNDLTGQTFNHLTAIEFVGLNNIKSSVWKFRCVCGTEIIRTGSQVKRGQIKSCGCLKIKMLTESGLYPNDLGIKTAAYKTHLKTAAKRGYSSELTFEEYCKIAALPCHYCGDISARLSPNGKRTAALNSVDRLNNEPYYTLSNAVSCCFICQRSKSALSECGFLDMVKKIYEYRKLGG